MIVNPISGKHYNINSEIGREILKIYLENYKYGGMWKNFKTQPNRRVLRLYNAQARGHDARQRVMMYNRLNAANFEREMARRRSVTPSMEIDEVESSDSSESDSSAEDIPDSEYEFFTVKIMRATGDGGVGTPYIDTEDGPLYFDKGRFEEGEIVKRFDKSSKWYSPDRSKFFYRVSE